MRWREERTCEVRGESGEQTARGEIERGQGDDSDRRGQARLNAIFSVEECCSTLPVFALGGMEGVTWSWSEGKFKTFARTTRSNA